MKYSAKLTSLFAAVGLLCLTACQATVADPMTSRNASLINSFQVFCRIAPPSFDALDQKATALKLPVRQDLGHSQTRGYFARSKSWAVSLKSGPHDLVATEANGPNGHIESCGISALDAKGDDFMNELVVELHLDASPQQTVTQDGNMRMTSWKNTEAGTEIQLVDATPKGRPGIMLFYRMTTASQF